MHISRRIASIVCVAALLLTADCAGPITQWMTDTRIHQGDAALERGNVRDAELSYRLALKVDPTDERARSGFVSAAADLAEIQYEKGQFQSALSMLADAAKYDPQNVRIAGLRASIEQAKLNREIVISNYPTYSLTGAQLQKSFDALDAQNKLVLKSLQRFRYTYDTKNLEQAIEQAYDLQEDVTKNLNRLIAYRQIVNSGIPAEKRGVTSTSGSLLPLP